MSSLIVEVVRIPKMERHPNADTLLIAHIKGWQCIVKEGQFQEGDLAVYIPPDSILPQDLIEKHNLDYLSKGEKVKAVKLRKVLSEGLLLTLPEGVKWREGDNVASVMGITKWEPPVRGEPQLQGPKKTHLRPNPNFKRYCDPENIKNFPNIFKEGDPVIITEKIHGTNFRCGWVKRELKWWERMLNNSFLRGLFHIDEWEFCVGSRNVHLVGRNKNKVYEGFDSNPYWAIAKRYDLANKIHRGVILFGEIYGEGIQDLTYGVKGIEVAFYDAMIDGEYVVQDVARANMISLGLPVVPLLHFGPFSAEKLAECTVGNTRVADIKQVREGCVVVSAFEEDNPYLSRTILKSINPDYVLRKNGTEFH